MKLRAFLVMSLLAATSSAALADEPATGADGDGSVPASDPVAPVTGVDVTAPAPLDGWAQIGTRSLVLPKDKVDVHTSLGIIAISSTSTTGNPPVTMTSTDTGEVLQLGGSYGVTDKIEAGIDFAFRVNPNFSLKGPVNLRGAYAAYKKGKLELAVAGSLNILVTDGIEINNGVPEETTEFNLGISLGAWVRYAITDKISVFTGQPATPISSLSTLGGGVLGFPPVPYQLTVGVNNDGPISLSIPAGVGIQATPEVYAFVATNIANIDISNSANAFIFADYIPMALGAFYTVNGKIDLGVSYTDDLKSIGDFFVIGLTGRYYVK